MKLVKPPPAPPTIRFSAELICADGKGKNRLGSRLTLPKRASAKLPTRSPIAIEATLNGFPFRAVLEPDGRGSHLLEVNPSLHEASDADTGDTATMEIIRIEDEPEARVPLDLRQALAAAPRAQAMWAQITPMARQNWILWLSSGKLEETRRIRIKKACSMLAAGKRRVCCFGGLNWLRKDHPRAGDTWRPLPKSAR